MDASVSHRNGRETEWAVSSMRRSAAANAVDEVGTARALRGFHSESVYGHFHFQNGLG
jgi:hypothetical protein